MPESRTQISGRAALLWLVAALGCVAVIAVAVIARRDDRAARGLSGNEWTLLAGALKSVADGRAASVEGVVAPGRYLTQSDARLARGPATLAIEAGSQLELGAGAALPSLISGRFTIETDQPFLLAGIEVSPVGAAMIIVTADGLVVASGGARARGRVFAEGERLTFARSSEIVAEPVPARGGAAQAASSPAPLPAGKVVDAASGAGIHGATVRAIFFHGADVTPAGTDDTAASQAGFDAARGGSGAATFPPLHVESVVTDADGTFSLTPVFEDDPRLAAYIEVDHPAYVPGTAVLASRADLRGRWNEVEVRLRRALAVRVEVTGPDGKPVAGAPVRVTSRSGGHAFIREETASRALDGRLVKLDPPALRFTGDDGTFRVPFSDHAYDFELLHPGLYFYYHALSREMVDRVTLVPPLEGPLRLAALPRSTERHLILDSDGLPVSRAEVELALESMPPLRLVTDDDGWLTVGVTPYPTGTEPLGLKNPRTGVLTVLTPELFKRSAVVKLPSLKETVDVQGRRASRLRFRCVTDDAFAPSPVPPNGVAVSLNMTLVRRSEDGEVELAGPLPAPGWIFDVYITGFLPARAVVPAHGRGGNDLDVDVGDVPFSRGLTREIVFTGAGRDGLRGASLIVDVPIGLEGVPSNVPAYQHRYRVGEGGRLLVGGLTQGAWTFGAEGPRLKAFSGVFTIDDALPEEPIEVPLVLTDEEDIVTAGRVADLSPFDCARCEVVERFSIAGASVPLAFPPYPLSPDGAFGSARRLRGVTGVEVSVISPAERAARAVVGRGAGLTLLAAGELRLRPQTRAEIAFVVENLGRVLPPLRVSLEGEAGVEDVARLRVRNRKLIADDLRAGNYTLRWLDDAGAEETFGFTVAREHTAKVEGIAKRSAHAEEAVEVRVTDSRGASIAGASVAPSFVGDAPEPLEPGVVLAKVTPRKRTELTIGADGFLPAHVDVEVGGVLPNEVALYRGAGAKARLLDADSREIDGSVVISWEPLTPMPIRHGDPESVQVKRGRLDAFGLPPLPLIFTLRLDGSDLSIRREWTLPEENALTAGGVPVPVDLGTLRFEETRKLTGVVLLSDGTPAEGAVVGLVPRERAYRFPLRGGGIEQALYTAKAGAGAARFVLDGLPVSFERPLALVAHLHGYEDAVEDPVDLDAEPHELLLGEEARLVVDAGYADGEVRAAYGFWLEYIGDLSDAGSRVELGEVVPRQRGGSSYVGIEPGIYRLKWGLRERYEPLPGLWEEAQVLSGNDSRIALRIEGRELHGRVTLNGKPVDRGWILLTDDPGATGGTSVGRILDGRFILLDPPESLHAYAAVVPEREPQPFQNIPRGEALPIPVRGYHASLRDGSFHLDYEAHDVTVRLEDDFLSRHQGAVLTLDHEQWNRTRFEPYPAEEPIEAPIVRLQLLRPGQHRIGVRSAKGTLIFSTTVDLKEDTTVEVR